MKYSGTLCCLAVLFFLSGCGSGGTADSAATIPAPGPAASPPPVTLSAEYSNPDLSLEPLADCQAVKDKAAASLLGQFLATEPSALSPRPITPEPLPALVTNSAGIAFLQRESQIFIVDGTSAGTLDELARFEFTGIGTADGLLLDEPGDRVFAVYANAPNPNTGFSPYGTTVVSIDVSDLSSPVEAGAIWLEGERLDISPTTEGFRIVNRAVTDRATRIWFLNPTLRQLMDQYRAAIGSGDVTSADVIAVDIEAIVNDAVGGDVVDTFLPFAHAIDSDDSLDPFECTDVYASRLDLRPGLAVITTINQDAGLVDRYAVANNSGDVATIGDTLLLTQSTDGLASDDGSRWSVLYAIDNGDDRPGNARYGAVSLPVTDIAYFDLDDGIGMLGQRFAEETKQDFFRFNDDGSNELVLSGEIVGFATGLRQHAPKFDDAVAVQVLNGLTPYWFVIDLRVPMPLGPVASQQPLATVLPLEGGPAFGLLQSSIGSSDTLALLDMTQANSPVILETARLSLVIEPNEVAIDVSRIGTFHDANASQILLPVRQSSDTDTFIGYVVVDVTAGLTTSALIDHSDLAFAALCGNEPTLAIPPGACDSNLFLDWVSAGTGITTTNTGGLKVVYAESSVGLTATLLRDGPPITTGLLLPYYNRP